MNAIPSPAMIGRPGLDFWTSTVESPLQPTWKSLAFERLCLQQVRQIKAARGIAGARTNVCPWGRAPDDLAARAE